LFGGWDYDNEDLGAADFVARGYAGGVPMGGTLSAAGKQAAPTFMVWASKDALSGNLDRIQIIKGWLDADGQQREKIYNVAWSGERKPDADGKLAAVGNTVDVAKASYTNSIGAPELSALWRDPDFDPSEQAFYYARVLEIPTPRWSTYDAKTLGIDVPEGLPASIQERAFSSPVWYRPSAGVTAKR
ncbi:MAG: DUF3604 domain-containing protein, partial [Halieaceae bacterium]|nr:DUF3604 domain-containing protein [Halieaceae bacterium]